MSGSEVTAIAIGRDQRDQLRQLCRHEIDRLDERGEAAIDAMDVARGVARRIDKAKRSPALMYVAGLDGLAQIARRELRGLHDVPEDDEQLDAFGERLNDRYSIRRKGWSGPKYVLRDSISKEEFAAQVLPMLKRRSEAYAKHYDLARAWNDGR